MKTFYLDDLTVRQRFVSGTYTMDAMEITRFATEYDPQPFHLDDAAARATLFGGLVASGWHTAGITMRLIVGGGLPIAGGIIGTGGELLWTNPVRPGDRLQVECEVLEITPSRSKPDRGTVVVRCLTKNQTGETVRRNSSCRGGRGECFVRGGCGMKARDLPDAMADRLIVALDVPTIEGASQLAARLDGIVSFFKIGLWLLFAPGAERFIDGLIGEGKQVFLDAKMYDIGETVRQGVARATERGVRLVTVHGDPEIMRAAVAGKGRSTRTKVFAISVLTSLNDAAVLEMGYALPVAELIGLRVRQAVACGCDGVIASADDHPNEIRQLANAEHLLVATPGIREPGGSVDDHKRHATPAQAIARGADYLVVGRPITQSDDPVAAARRIIVDMERGAATHSSRGN